jgi:AraC family transcriptional regulator, transcriptional activator of pobA
MIDRYDFYKTKYGPELLIDLIRLESLEKYILKDTSHFLTYYDITLILKGKGNLMLDNNVFEIQKNRIICSSPMQIRKWEIDKAPEGLVLIFEEDFLSTFFNDIQFVKKLNFFHTILNKPVLSLSDEGCSYFENVLLNIEKEIVNNENRSNHLLRALLYQVLAWLDREYTKHTTVEEVTSNNLISDFKDLVNTFYDKGHSVHFYADKLHISPGYLNDLVKKYMRISAKQYIQNRVFLEAKRLLGYTSLSVSEIAWKLNFKDDSYFVRAFKKETGYTPKMYRSMKDS